MFGLRHLRFFSYSKNTVVSLSSQPAYSFFSRWKSSQPSPSTTSPIQDNPNIKSRDIKYTDIAKQFLLKNYSDGLSLTKQYINQKETNFGIKYEGYEDDLFILGQFSIYLADPQSTNQALDCFKESFKLALERKNLKTSSQAIEKLIFMWKYVCEFDIKEMVKSHLNLLQSEHANIENYYMMYLHLAGIEKELGNFQEATKLTEECAFFLEQETLWLQRQVDEDEIKNNEEVKEGDEVFEKQKEITRRLNKCLLGMQNIHLFMASNAVFAREWEAANLLMSSVEDSLKQIKLKEEQEEDAYLQKILSQLKLSVLISRQQFYFHQQQIQKSEEVLNQAAEYLNSNQYIDKNEDLLLASAQLTLHQKEIEKTSKYLESLEQLKLSDQSLPHRKDVVWLKLKILFLIQKKDYQKAKQGLKEFQIITQSLVSRLIHQIQLHSLQAEFFQAFNQLEESEQQWQDCMKKAEEYYGEEAEQTHKFRVRLFSIQLKQQDKWNKSNNEAIQLIASKAQSSIQVLKNKSTFGSEHELKLQQIINDLISHKVS